MKRVILYLRVSTDGQTDGYSLEYQKEKLLDYCRAHDWVVVAIVTDPGYTGANLERPGIQRVIHEVESGGCDMVLVYKLDRLSRSQKDTLWLIEDCFLPAGVDFTSMQEKLDTSTPFGRAMVGILSVFAQLEREFIKERTFSGRVKRAQDGLWHGGGYHPIGYDYIAGQLVINQQEAAQVRRVYDLYASGASVTEIRDHMFDRDFRTKHGDWSNTETVRAVLDNPLYSGVVHFDGALSDSDAHTAIVGRSLYDRVRVLRDRSVSTHYRESDSEHLLTGFVFCACCGARYFPKKNRAGNVYYHCHSRAKVNREMVRDPACKNDNWKKGELEAYVEDELLRLASDGEYLRKSIKKRAAGDSDSSLVTDRAALARIDEDIRGAMADYAKPDGLSVDEVSAKINELYTRKKELSEKLAGFMDQTGVVACRVSDAAASLLRDVADSWSSWDIKRRRYVLRMLLDRALIEGEVIHFVWSFT